MTVAEKKEVKEVGGYKNGDFCFGKRQRKRKT